MWSQFRKKHLQLLLKGALSCKGSLDFLVHKYFKENRCLGSKDRVAVKQGVYEIIKWKGLLEAGKPKTADELVEIYTSERCPIAANVSHLPSHIQVSFPDWLFKKLVESLGYEEAMIFCKKSNEQAPATIRINPLKCNKNVFYKKYKEELGLTPCEHAENGFHVGKRTKYDSLPEYKSGGFEPQDEASQIIAEAVNAKPGLHILDYCAGSGGKTLAFAPAMKGKGQVYLHDIRNKALLDAKKRLKRAGVQNFQLFHGESDRLNRLKGHMDVVLADAPCSCSGTFRRRPEQKWNLTPGFIEEIAEIQRDIIVSAIPYVKAGGIFIYATCSVLEDENESQTMFLKTREDLTFISEKKVLLEDGGSDAMYLSVFKKNSLV